MHARRSPEGNVFRYPVYQWLVDPDELPELDRRYRLFGWNRRAVTTWHDRDHIDIPAYLAANGVELGAGGRLLCLTNMRVLGYVFNPVSFWWCYRGDGELACIVAEINNTFGERLPYLLSPPNQLADGRHRVYGTDKRIHVSPFMSMDQSYTWHFSEPGDRVYVADRRPRGRPASLPRHARGRPCRVDPGVAAGGARALSADAREGDLADPPPGGPSCAQARAVRPETALRARTGDDPAVKLAGDVARRIVFRALERLRGGRARARLSGRARAQVRGRPGPARRREHPPAGRLLAQARAADAGRFRRVVRRRRLGRRRPRRALRAPLAQPPRCSQAPLGRLDLPTAAAPARSRRETDARRGPPSRSTPTTTSATTSSA